MAVYHQQAYQISPMNTTLSQFRPHDNFPQIHEYLDVTFPPRFWVFRVSTFPTATICLLCNVTVCLWFHLLRLRPVNTTYNLPRMNLPLSAVSDCLFAATLQPQPYALTCHGDDEPASRKQENSTPNNINIQYVYVEMKHTWPSQCFEFTNWVHRTLTVGLRNLLISHGTRAVNH
jgi:hypothetical protein